ncbi:uncharacterized protein LOC114309208 [Camellia sinensis]|uniref:uncharacterized protein LOC114309208 n=1 Tax=Camellia sinensis TaxID=4442 RepID=UPI00103656EA|nr:uncharacterized protein LOC114309208 [Camellia sinensis]
MNEEKSKRTHNETESNTPKRLKSVNSRAFGRTKEDLRDYLQKKWLNAEVTSPIKPRTSFSVKLDTFEASKRFHMPRFQIYDGKSDPNFHVNLYLNSIALYSGNGQLLCKVVLSSFGKIASDWFHNLLKGTVKSWEGLTEIFKTRFVTNKLQPLRVDSLLALNISDGESLRAYVKRYYEVFNRIPACNQELAIVSFKNGLDDECPLRKSLAKTLPRSKEELMARIEKYAKVEEDTQVIKTPKQEKKNSSPKRGRGNSGVNRQKTGLRCAQAVTTVFRIPIYKVLERIRNQPYYRAPEKNPIEFMRMSIGKHCAYHNEDGHITQGSRALKSHLEDLVR